jgi:hypothetical protein
MPTGNTISKKQVVVPAITAALILMMAPAILSTGAFAQNAHFVGRQTADVDISGDTATLSVSGKVAGLGSDPVTVFVSTSGATVETECDNPGRGANPPGQDATFGPTEGDEQTITPRNGQITYRNVDLSVTVSAEDAGCPPSMEAVITSATFEDVTVHVIQNGEEIIFEFDTVSS